MPENLFSQQTAGQSKNQNSTFKAPPQGNLPPIFHKAKGLYLLWYGYYQILPKTHRYTLGKKIDECLLSILENIATATFLTPTEKQPYIKFAIKKTDLLKILSLLLWETKTLDDKKYTALAERETELGRMLGGWSGKIASKQNSPANQLGEK